MANKNTNKVKRRRERRAREKAAREFLDYASKRQALLSLGTVCTNEGGDELVDCYHLGLSNLAMYSLKQAVDKYTDCELVPKLDNGGFIPLFKGKEEVEVPHEHEWERDKSGLDSSLKFAKQKRNCRLCLKEVQPRPSVQFQYDKFENKFSRLFLEAFRDGAFSQLDVIRQEAGLDDQQWAYVLTHAAFSFTPNLEKSKDLVVINQDASHSNN